MAEGRNEEKAKAQVRSGSCGWGLAALIAGLLPPVGAVATFLLPRPACFYALPASYAIFGLCAVVFAVTALRLPGRRRGLAITGLVLGAGWVAVASVSLPAVPRGMAHSCLTSVRQLAWGVGMYAADHDNSLPPADTWPEALFPYVKNSGLYACPVDGTHDPRGNPMDAAFSMNRYLGGASLTAASGLPLLFDGNGLKGDKTTAAFRHSGGLNVSYVDGHAQWLSRKAFLDGSLKPKTQP